MTTVASTTSAGALVDEAVRANAAGRPYTAQRLLSRAQREADREPDPQVRMLAHARIDITRALSLFELGDPSRAHALLDHVNATIADVQRGPLHALAEVQRAGLHGRSGHWDRTRDILLTVDLSPATTHPRTACLARLQLGLAHQFLGDHTRSDQCLQQAHQSATAHGFTDLAMAALHNRGRLRQLRGDLAGALQLMDQAREVSHDVMPSSAHLDHAEVLIEAGLLEDAEVLLGHARMLARNSRLVHDVAEVDLELARIRLLRREDRDAVRLAARALRRFRAHGEEPWAVRADLVRLDGLLRQGRAASVVADATGQLDSGAAERAGVGTEFRLLLAEGLALSGAPEAGLHQVQLVSAAASQRGAVRLQRQLALARVHSARGDAAAARRALVKGAKLIASAQSAAGGLDSRAAVTIHSQGLVEAHLDLALEDGSPAGVFAATELWRGISFRLPLLSRPADPEVLDLIAEARRLRHLAIETSTPAERDAANASAARIEARIRHLEHRSGNADRRESASRPVSLTAAGAALRSVGAGLVGLFHHRGRLRAISLTSRSARVNDLGSAREATAMAQRLRIDLQMRAHATGPMRAAVQRSTDSTLARLDALLSPAIPTTERVVILPTWALGSMPWRLLPSMRGRLVTVAPSATVWALPGPRPSPTPTPLGVAPVKDAMVEVLIGPGLSAADAEGERVSATWPGAKLRRGPEANGAALGRALATADIVHVAAHGLHHDESPLFSTIRMVDGPVFAHELQHVDIRAAHVVLSTCELGTAQLRPGDEAVGLTAALLSCGVRSVLAATAPVLDRESAELMPRYHQFLSQGHDASEALELAGAGLDEAFLFANYGTDWRVSRD